MLSMFNESRDFQKSINFIPMKDTRGELAEIPFIMSELQNNHLWMIALNFQDDKEGGDGFHQLIKYDISSQN